MAFLLEAVAVYGRTLLGVVHPGPRARDGRHEAPGGHTFHTSLSWREVLRGGVHVPERPDRGRHVVARELDREQELGVLHVLLADGRDVQRSEEHTSELQSLMRNS